MHWGKKRTTKIILAANSSVSYINDIIFCLIFAAQTGDENWRECEGVGKWVSSEAGELQQPDTVCFSCSAYSAKSAGENVMHLYFHLSGNAINFPWFVIVEAFV